MSFSSFFDYSGVAAPEEADGLVFLPDLSDADWAKLLAHTEMYRFVPGDTVIRAGETERALYIVADGTLELLIPQAGGRGLRRLATIAPGAVIGEMTFFDGRPRSATIRAVTECEMFRLSFEEFEVLAARAPALARTILFDLGRILAARLRQTNTLLGA